MRGLISFVLTGASCAGAAEAAPWVRSEGGWYARALIAHDNLDGAEGWRTDAYGEYGLTSKITITAKAERVTFPDAAAFDRDAYRLTLRREMFAHKGWVGGIEAGAVHGSTVTGVFGCEGYGVETRGGIGWSGMPAGRAGYGFADIAHIAQEDGCRRTRIEAGIGQDLTDRVFLGQQVWYEEGNQSARSVKTESQIGLHFSHFDVSLGYREEIGGQFNESAVLVALVARR